VWSQDYWNALHVASQYNHEKVCALLMDTWATDPYYGVGSCDSDFRWLESIDEDVMYMGQVDMHDYID
jgi:hypothetical protein